MTPVLPARRARKKPTRPRLALRTPVLDRWGSAVDRFHPLIVVACALVISGGIHAFAVAATAGMRHARLPVRAMVKPVRVAVVEKPPEPPPVPEAVPEVPKLARAVRARTPAAKDQPPPPGPQAPEPVQAPPPDVVPAAAQTPVLVTGVSLSATTKGGTMAVPVGNSSAGARTGTPTAAGDGRPYKAAEFAESYALSEMPVFLDNLTADRVRSFYPEAARKAKLEGAVKTQLTVDDDGQVVKVVVIDDPGHGFGDAARRLARLYRFKPAQKDGRKVATEIPFTIHFQLD